MVSLHTGVYQVAVERDGTLSTDVEAALTVFEGT